MVVYKEIVLIVIPILYVVWNVLNESSVSLFWNTQDKKYITKWHQYDAAFRVILFPLVLTAIGGFTIHILKIMVTCAILYRPIFNLGFNYMRNNGTFKSLTFREKLHVLLYLSEYSVIDRIIIRINNWLYKYMIKIFKKWNTRFEYFNLFLIIIEFTLAILIWILF